LFVAGLFRLTGAVHLFCFLFHHKSTSYLLIHCVHK
jgi:hypothetical protein